MAGLINRRGNVTFRPQTLAALYSKFHRSNCTLAQKFMEKCSTIHPVIDEEEDTGIDTSKWSKVKASDAGIDNSMIPESSLNVLRLLRRQGFDAYLVGGCVRDLILHRVPKDFDVITTANLKQIRSLFHRAVVVGRRFPICHVWMRGSMIEVSSFDTVAQSDSERKNDLKKSMKRSEKDINSSLFKRCSGWDVKDYNRWKNSMVRDFTINSLFFDPFLFKVYDYTNGMGDLKDKKLRTLAPAHLSFKEDCARVLRGFRLAARLGLSFSKDIQKAIPESLSSVADLNQGRLIMEMNYMLAYGASAPSILLLMKFKLLHFLLPFQAAYLDQASKTFVPNSLMLVRLLSNMDKLLSCEHPADSRLWIAVLAFHIALVRKPQEATVLCAFSSLLYHRNWRKAVEFAREHESSVPGYTPEVVSKSTGKRSDEDLAKAVSEFVNLIKDTLYIFTEMDALREALCLYPNFKCSSGLVFVPKKKGSELAGWLARVSDVESYESQKDGFSIDYYSLGKGNAWEIGFVLGKVIMDTVTEEIVIEQIKSVKKKHSTKKQKKDELVISKRSKEDKDSEAPPDNGLKAFKKIMERTNKNDKESKVCLDKTVSGPEKEEDQSVVPKVKRRRSKKTLVSEEPKPKSSKRSRSGEEEKEEETVVKVSNKCRRPKEPVSDLPKQKTSINRLKETEKVKPIKVSLKEIEEAIDGSVPQQSVSDILNVLETSRQEVSSKEDSESAKKKPRKLSSLFK